MNLKVAIFEHQELGKPCAESCGVNWLVAENQRLAEEALKHRFGDKVEVNFYNLAETDTLKRFPHIAHLLKEQSLYLPLLVVNGQVRISGYFDHRMLIDTLDAETDFQLA